MCRLFLTVYMRVSAIWMHSFSVLASSGGLMTDLLGSVEEAVSPVSWPWLSLMDFISSISAKRNATGFRSSRSFRKNGTLHAVVLDHVADHRPHAGVVIDIRKTEKSEGRLVQFQAAVLAWIVEHMYLCIRMLGLKQGDTGQKTIHDFIIPVRQEICHMVYHLSDPSLQFITALFLHPIYYNILF